MAEGRRCGKVGQSPTTKSPGESVPCHHPLACAASAPPIVGFGQVPLDLSTEHAHPCAYMGSSPRSPSLGRVVWLFPHDGAHLTSIVAAAAIPPIALTARRAAWSSGRQTPRARPPLKEKDGHEKPPPSSRRAVAASKVIPAETRFPVAQQSDSLLAGVSSALVALWRAWFTTGEQAEHTQSTSHLQSK